MEHARSQRDEGGKQREDIKWQNTPIGMTSSSGSHGSPLSAVNRQIDYVIDTLLAAPPPRSFSCRSVLRKRESFTPMPEPQLEALWNCLVELNRTMTVGLFRLHFAPQRRVSLPRDVGLNDLIKRVHHLDAAAMLLLARWQHPNMASSENKKKGHKEISKSAPVISRCDRATRVTLVQPSFFECFGPRATGHAHGSPRFCRVSWLLGAHLPLCPQA